MVTLVLVALLANITNTGFTSASDIGNLEYLLQKNAPSVLEDLMTVADDEDPVNFNKSEMDSAYVEIKGGDDSVFVTLPEGHIAMSSVTVAGKEMRLLENKNNFETLPLTKTGGSVQILTVLDNNESPSEFKYTFNFVGGVNLRMDKDGFVYIEDNNGNFIGGVAPAWAVAADGKRVETHYRIEGNALIQVVDHKGAKYQYPIIADPWAGVDLYYQPYVSYPGPGYAINVTPTAWGGAWTGVATWWAHVAEVKDKLGSHNAWRWTSSIQEQFYCHIAGWPASLPEYNLESWRPTVNWAHSLGAHKCNP